MKDNGSDDAVIAFGQTVLNAAHGIEMQTVMDALVTCLATVIAGEWHDAGLGLMDALDFTDEVHRALGVCVSDKWGMVDQVVNN